MWSLEKYKRGIDIALNSSNTRHIEMNEGGENVIKCVKNEELGKTISKQLKGDKTK